MWRSFLEGYKFRIGEVWWWVCASRDLPGKLITVRWCAHLATNAVEEGVGVRISRPTWGLW